MTIDEHMQDIAEKTVRYAMDIGAQYCDIRAEEYETGMIKVDNGQTEYADISTDHGIGIRVLDGQSWKFVSLTAPRTFEQIKHRINSMIKNDRSSEKRVHIKDVKPTKLIVTYPVLEKPDIKSMIALATECSDAMLDVQDITKSIIMPRYVVKSKYFTNSNGTQIQQDYTDVVMHINATARSLGVTQSVDITEGGRGGMEMIRKSDTIQDISIDTAHKASQLTRAKTVKADTTSTTVVLNPDFVALLVHEILGHPSEADRVMGKEMAWAGGAWWKGMIGQRIGSEELNVFDDPTIEKSLGWYDFDDEGVKTGKTTLVQDGILAGHMQSKETSRVFGVESTGNMRAASYRHMPLIRMACTCIGPGTHNPNEMIKDVKDGYLISNMKVPSIDMRRYNWSISCQYAHKIKDGQITDMYRDVIVVGNAPDFFKSIDACGDDFMIRPITNCGKGDPMQSMFMGNGGPTVRGTATIRSTT